MVLISLEKTILNNKAKILKVKNLRNHYHKLLLRKNQILNGMMLLAYKELKPLCNKLLFCLQSFHNFLLVISSLGKVFYYMVHLELVKAT